MAASAAREAQRKDGKRQSYKIGDVAIYKGTLVCVQVEDGYLYPAASTDPSANTDLFAGVAFESYDNSAGSAGAASIQVEKTGSFVFAMTEAAQTDVGGPAYASDDMTVLNATQNSGEVLVGYITEIIDSGHVRVRIDRAVQ